MDKAGKDIRDKEITELSYKEYYNKSMTLQEYQAIRSLSLYIYIMRTGFLSITQSRLKDRSEASQEKSSRAVCTGSR